VGVGPVRILDFFALAIARIQQHLDEAIRLDSQFAVAYNNRGNAYNNLGQSQRAIHDLDEAIRLNPQLAEPYVNRAFSYTLLGEDAKAQHDIERSVERGFDRAFLELIIEEAKRLR